LTATILRKLSFYNFHLLYVFMCILQLFTSVVNNILREIAIIFSN